LEGKNEDFVLLRPGYDCSGVFYNTNEYIWYGYYQEHIVAGKPNKKPYRKQIMVEFINTADEMTGSGTIVKEDKNLRFIIGAKKIFPEVIMNDISSRKLYHRSNRNSPTLTDDIITQGIITMDNNIEDLKPYSFSNFFINRENKKQSINLRVNNFQLHINQLYIQADLDGDGLDDFIIDYGDSVLNRGLFLSSEAGEDEVAKLVSVFQRGPCC